MESAQYKHGGYGYDTELSLCVHLMLLNQPILADPYSLKFFQYGFKAWRTDHMESAPYQHGGYGYDTDLSLCVLLMLLNQPNTF